MMKGESGYFSPGPVPAGLNYKPIFDQLKIFAFNILPFAEYLLLFRGNIYWSTAQSNVFLDPYINHTGI
jgi:hypothetical protein